MKFSPDWISAASAVIALIIVAISAHAALRQIDVIRVSERLSVLDKVEALAAMASSHREPDWPKMPEEMI